jgi:non-specific serine/threonine protein kinase/serine/threonine-protein kinase
MRAAGPTLPEVCGMEHEDTLDERDIFEQALELPAAERAAYVATRCGVDAELEQRIGRLLAAHEAASDASNVAWSPADAPPTPEWVDSYRILQRLGEGGMGVVYLAEQTEPVRRRVALKILKSGMDSKEVVARFRAEQQALALMNHPNIARILEAGMVDGRPYFVMEHVAGVPITEYCDRRCLGVGARLRLFIEVCQGAQHAHQKGIIHRDLKPTNILVMEEEGRGIPKIIDFGIAKAVGLQLSDQTIHTEFGRLIGTPEYMSPEQARTTALDVDTRTDVYALGALLYELLVGVPLFDFRSTSLGLVDMQRTILDDDPERPSTRLGRLPDAAVDAARKRQTEPEALARRLRDDLDWITLKAIEKDRSRRYASASELAADIDRHLAGRTVVARPPSAAYRVRKFVRRHRLSVTAVGAIAASLVAAALVSLGFAVSEANQRTLAEDAGREAVRERDTALAIIDFLTEDLLSAVQPSAEAGQGRDVSMRAVLDAAAERIEESSRPGGRFHERPLVEAKIRETLAITYERLAVFDEAERHAQRALELRRAHLGEEHEETLVALHDLAILYQDQGRYAEAEPLLTRVLEVRARREPERSKRVAHAQVALASLYARTQRFDEAEAMYRRALETREALLGPDDPWTLTTRVNLGSLLYILRRHDEAEPLLAGAVDAQTRILGEDHPDTLVSKKSLAAVYAETGRIDEAGRLMAETLEASKRVYGEDHPDPLIAMANLARFYARAGQFERAEPLAKTAVDRMAAVLGETHTLTLSALEALHFVYASQSRPDLAEPVVRRYLDGWLVRIESNEAGAKTINQLAWMLLTSEHESIRDPVLGLELAERADRMADHADPEILDTLARALHENGDTAAALEHQRRALELVPEDAPNRHEYEEHLAMFEAAQREAEGVGP